MALFKGGHFCLVWFTNDLNGKCYKLAVPFTNVIFTLVNQL